MELELHDAFFSSVECFDGIATLRFVKADESRSLTIPGVVALAVSPFLAGNIVDNVELTTGNMIPQILSGMSQELRSAFETYYDASLIAKDPEVRAFALHASYGAEVICLFKR